jgi:hypothetical protein
MLAEDEFSQGSHKLADTYFVRRIDLNGDGSLEYIVDSHQRYSGGAMHVIFERRKRSYQSIGTFQGGFDLAARVNGYYQICGWSRIGAGYFDHYILRFIRGEYREYKLYEVHQRADGIIVRPDDTK